MPPSVAHVALTDEDTRYLRGERGACAALAMRVVLAVAASMGASRLVDIESAHVDGCLYVGSVSIDFARALVDGRCPRERADDLERRLGRFAASAQLEWLPCASSASIAASRASSGETSSSSHTAACTTDPLTPFAAKIC